MFGGIVVFGPIMWPLAFTPEFPMVDLSLEPSNIGTGGLLAVVGRYPSLYKNASNRDPFSVEDDTLSKTLCVRSPAVASHRESEGVLV